MKKFMSVIALMLFGSTYEVSAMGLDPGLNRRYEMDRNQRNREALGLTEEARDVLNHYRNESDKVKKLLVRQAEACDIAGLISSIQNDVFAPFIIKEEMLKDVICALADLDFYFNYVKFIADLVKNQCINRDILNRGIVEYAIAISLSRKDYYTLNMFDDEVLLEFITKERVRDICLQLRRDYCKFVDPKATWYRSLGARVANGVASVYTLVTSRS